ncbi:hypothetical protein FXO37_04520 [Capsicum annuum]|nr:hypothetical protein FXO37_04520 [Capsicum annuum]
MVGEDHINVEDHFTSFSTLPPCTTTPHFTTADSFSAYSSSAPTATPSVATSTTAASVAAPSATQPSAIASSVALPSTAAPSVAARIADAVDDIDVGPTESDFLGKVEGSDYSTEDSVDLEEELVRYDDDEDCGSDVHKEVRKFRVEKKKFQRIKRNERVPTDNAEIPVGEAGPDLGFDDTEIGKVSHNGRLEGDGP